VNYPEFYSALFRVTLPETALELAALLVLIVDLGFLRKAALKVRVTVAALLVWQAAERRYGRFNSRRKAG